MFPLSVVINLNYCNYRFICPLLPPKKGKGLVTKVTTLKRNIANIIIDYRLPKPMVFSKKVV